MLKIVTWNVNSVKARRERLLALLARHAPDVVCLQELKAENAAFPLGDVNGAGYQAILHGQKTYNGVAILAKSELLDAKAGFADGADDAQARFLEATVAGVRVLCVYAPNGGEVHSEKWAYKLTWFDRLQAHLTRVHRAAEPLVLCGDLNVAPDDKDVARPDEWRDTVLCAEPARSAFRRLIGWGLQDVVRQHHPEGGPYTYWDYRMLGFQKNNGLRIDHILATAELARVCTGASVDREERKGKQPSDHAPVIATFDVPAS
jgi:exodeoxyribonuclease III